MLIADFGLPTTSDWPDIIDAINSVNNQKLDFLNDILYSELFNDKAMAIYENSDFKKYIAEYIDSLENLLQRSPLLNTRFTEHSAEELSKSLASNNLFEGQHRILLRDGTQVCD